VARLLKRMTKMRTKDKIFFGQSMGLVNVHIGEQIKVHTTQTLELAKERNTIMQEISKIAWKLKIRSKESQRINWHYARRHKETIPQLEKLLADMRIEYVYQQAGGIDE
jgi:malonyl CoA-acyl carrier protein transacylase